MKRNPNPRTPIINPKTLPNLFRIFNEVKNVVSITGATKDITTTTQNNTGNRTKGLPQSNSNSFIVLRMGMSIL